MKKLFFFAVAAAMMVACSNEELNVQDNVQKKSQEAPVQFDVYAQRSVTTRGGQAGDLNNVNIGATGFGVFAYYTAGEQYDTKATPNFMYNQKVISSESPVNTASKWTYEPVKYWPNEFGNAAISDEIDYVTFFAYAPWTQIEPTTGHIVPKEGGDESVEHQQSYNIISVNKNTATGDPIIKYAVDTDPATSVDLLWGVAAETADKTYSPIDGAAGGKNAGVKVTPGKPFLNLVKPNNPVDDRLQFNLKHALAKVKVTIDYIKDDFTPAEGPLADEADKIDNLKTRIFVRNFTMSGFAMKGALNLNNTEAGEPLWKDFDGVKDLNFDEVTFQDGRKDGKEGETNGDQNNETPQGLNPQIVENYALTTTNDAEKYGSDQIVFDADKKNTGVTEKPQLLFGGKDTQNGGFFYVIPRNDKGSKVDVTIAYDVETIDSNLAGKLSDGETHGISIENIISKKDILGGLDFMAGKQYEINIHIGMTSVKIDATVTDWVDNGKTDVELPDNQEPFVGTYWTIGNDATIYTSDPSKPFEMTADRIFVIKDEASFNKAWAAGPLKRYYDELDKACPLNDDGTPKNTQSAWTNEAYDKESIDWDDLDPRHHSWNSYMANHRHTEGMVIFDLAYDPLFKGLMEVEYDGATAPGFGASGYTVDKLYGDVDRTFICAGGADFATGLTITEIDAKKIKVTLTRNNVTVHNY